MSKLSAASLLSRLHKPATTQVHRLDQDLFHLFLFFVHFLSSSSSVGICIASWASGKVSSDFLSFPSGPLWHLSLATFPGATFSSSFFVSSLRILSLRSLGL